MRRWMIWLVLAMVLFGCRPSQTIEDPDDEVVVEDPVEEPVEEPVTEVFRSVFNGSSVEEGIKYKAVAVMIENSSAARPQSGISLADIVYEIAVDGWQISRFLAIFQSQMPSKVGPNRSARIPFVQIQLEWMLPFAHYGAAETGLGNAYSIIRNTKWPIRFDGVSGLNDQYFSRDLSRYAPHNAYFDAKSSLAKIPELSFERRFLFDDDPSVGTTMANAIQLDYSSINKIKYSFDPISKKYLRYINDQPMMDDYNNEQVSVTNIILLYAPHTAVEKYDYVLVNFISTGKAEFFVNGQYIEGKWVKSSEKAITQYFDLVGNEIRFLPGNTWVQVVSERVKISYQ